MFEHHTQPLLPRGKFLIRFLRYTGFTVGLLGISLSIGVAGYHFLDELPWLDSLLNASMILAGMGPVDPLKNAPAKWFASFYAIYGGVAFMSTIAVFLSPLAHRFLHKYQLDEGKK